MNSPADPAPNNPPDGWYYRLVRFGSHAWKFTIRTSLAILVLLLGIPLYSAIFDRSFVIGEFSVPDELKKTGITSSVIGRLFFDRIAEMQRVANSAVAESHLGAQAFGSDATSSKVADIKLPGAGISLLTLVSQLRALLHIQDTTIVGEIVTAKDGQPPCYLLRAHATGGDVWVEGEQGHDIGPLVSTIASRLVERFDPLVAGFYHYRTPQKDAGGADTGCTTEKDVDAADTGGDASRPKSNLDTAIGFADGFHSRDKKQQVRALVLRGIAWREKQGNPEETRASLCAAIRLDPTFVPAWRILAQSLRNDKSLAEARDLALRLIKDQPDEPEGYRALGSLHGDCVAGSAEEEDAIRGFTKALKVGARRSSSQADYLSRVDYARFLYAWYKPPHAWPKRPPDGATPIDYLTLAADYLDEAQAMAPNESSVYTNFARALGHPRLPDEIKDARGLKFSGSFRARHAVNESRLLDAELKARYALTLDSTPRFANFVLGELLTDQGFELLDYVLELKKRLPSDNADAANVSEIRVNEDKARDKFAKAQEYINRSRQSATRPESLYEAVYARAWAGAGDLAQAEKLLVPFEKSRRKTYSVEWVHGEMLLRNKRYEEALVHLNAAESLRTCGPRSNVVRQMITRIEAELAKARLENVEKATETREPRRAAFSRPPAKHEAQPLPDPEPACSDWKKLEGDELTPYRRGRDDLWETRDEWRPQQTAISR